MVPPASGSMKPVVERIFGDIETNLKDILEHKGLIRRVYGSKHHKEACIDINDATKVILDYVSIYICSYKRLCFKKCLSSNKKTWVLINDYVSRRHLWCFPAKEVYGNVPEVRILPQTLCSDSPKDRIFGYEPEDTGSIPVRSIASMVQGRTCIKSDTPSPLLF